MRLAWTANGKIRGGKIQVHAVHPEQLGEIRAIDHRQHVQPVYARYHPFSLDIRQPAGIDDEFLNPSGFGQ
jgi:hypothetical protein